MSDRGEGQANSGFWNFNIGHVAILVTVLGGGWGVVNSIETTLADHTARISHLESEENTKGAVADSKLNAIGGQLNDLGREVSRIQGRLDTIGRRPGDHGENAPPGVLNDDTAWPGDGKG